MKPLSTHKQLLGLLAWLFTSFTALALGAIASIEAKTFYSLLRQPDWAPPAWLFGPVWTLLFILMGIAAWLVWRSGGFFIHRRALALFIAQLVCNVLWSWLFFVSNSGLVALIDIILLWWLIVATLLAFWRVTPVAGILLTPYLLWVSFALLLNYSLWQLNPQLLG